MMLWIREEKVFTKFNYGLAEQSCKELYLHGFCGDVGREDPEAPPPIFLSLFLPGYAPGNGRLPLNGAREHLPA